METLRGKWSQLAGSLTVVIFLILLAVRLDLFPSFSSRAMEGREEKNPGAHAAETWLSISQNGKKIGYAHRILAPAAGGYELRDDVFMRINTMGVVQGLTLETRGTLNPDMSLSTFQIRLASNLFRFTARGECTGRKMTLWVGEAGGAKAYHIELKEVPYLSGSVADAAFRAGLRSGETQTFSMFDPASMGVRPVKVSLLGEEMRPVGGKPQRVKKFSVDFMGARQMAWLDEKGRIVREEGILGLVMESVSREEAMEGLTAGGIADMTELASVASNEVFREPATLPELKIKISGIDVERFFLDGGRQTYRDGLLVIRRETPAEGDRPELPPDSQTRERYSAVYGVRPGGPSPHTRRAGDLATQDASDLKVRKIIRWVSRHLEKQPVLSVSNAVETLERRKGDCTEHAVLAAALGRAAGIPSTVETGLVYQKGRFYYHAWNVFFLEENRRWITADAVLDQVPADVTHIRFVRGEAQEQLDLIGLMGRLKLEIIR